MEPDNAWQYNEQSYPIWFIIRGVVNAATVDLLLPLDPVTLTINFANLGFVPNFASPIRLATESFASEHSMLIVGTGMQNTLTMDIEMMQHLEGELDNAHLYLESRSSLLSTAYHSPLQLLRMHSSTSLFASPEMIRDQYILAVLGDYQVTGVWDETLVPLAKDLVRWGVDKISNSGTDIMSVIGDVAGLALAELAPELLPAFRAIADVVKP